MLLAKTLIDKENEMRAAGTWDGRLPQIPLHEARQIMTNADWIKSHDHNNIFNIDSAGMVRADSVAMQNAMRDICSREGFDQHLQDTLDRLDEIESLHRTRELTLKDLGGNGRYLAMIGKGSDAQKEVVISLKSDRASLGNS